ncbi:Golgi reassembly-stacking protein 1 isoform 1-T1 [Vipera latastei]
MIRGLKAKTYKERLLELGTSSLMKRRTRGDMIAVFQYLRGFHKEEAVKLFSKAPEGRTRSSGWELIKERSNLELRSNFLTVRTINQWNNLPPEVDVEPASPAALAGLKPHSDYIIGSDQILHESEDFFSLIDSHEGKPLKLVVYNTEMDACREVFVTPNGAWGGEGSLGCGIGYGYLHRIPTQAAALKRATKAGVSPPLPSEDAPPESPANGYMEASLMAPNLKTEETESLDYISGQSVTPYSLENSLHLPTPPPPPLQRVMDPGFIDMSGASFPELIDLVKTAHVPSSPPFTLSDVLEPSGTLSTYSETHSSFDQASLPFSEESVSLQADESSPELLEGKPCVSPLPPLPMDTSPNSPSGLDAEVQETVGHHSGVETPMLPKTDSSEKGQFLNIYTSVSRFWE